MSGDSPFKKANHRISSELRIFDLCTSVSHPKYELKDATPLIRALNILQGNPRTPQSPQAGFFFLCDNHNNNNTIQNSNGQQQRHHMLVIKCFSRDANISSTAFIENPMNSVFEPCDDYYSAPSSTTIEKNNNNNNNNNFHHGKSYKQESTFGNTNKSNNNNNQHQNVTHRTDTLHCILPTFIANVNDILDSIQYCFQPYIGMKMALEQHQQQQMLTTATTSATGGFINSTSNMLLSSASSKMFSSFFLGGRIRSTYNKNTTSNQNIISGKNGNGGNNNNNNNVFSGGAVKNELRMNFCYLPDSTASNPRVDVSAILGDKGEVGSHATTFPMTKDSLYNWIGSETTLVHPKEWALSALPSILSCSSLDEAGIFATKESRIASNVGGFEDYYHNDENDASATMHNLGFPQQQQQQHHHHQQAPLLRSTVENMFSLPHNHLNNGNNNINNFNFLNHKKQHLPHHPQQPTRGPVNGIIFKSTYARELFADIVTMECSRVNVAWTKDRFTVTGRNSVHGDVVVEINKPLSQSERRRRIEHEEERRATLQQNGHLFGWNDANRFYLKEEPVLSFHCEKETVQADYQAAHFATAFGLEAKGDFATGGGRSSNGNFMSGGSYQNGNNNNNNNIYADYTNQFNQTQQQLTQNVVGNNNIVNAANNNNNNNPNGVMTMMNQFMESTVTVQINEDRQLRVIHDNGFGVKIVIVIRARVRDEDDTNILHNNGNEEEDGIMN